MEYPNLENLAQALLAQGLKIEAVRQVRQATGWGLKEAKDYVESLIGGGELPAFTAASVDYTAFSDAALLAALEYAGDAPHPDLIRACLARQEALTPELLALLAADPDDDWAADDPRWYRNIHAGLLLCAFREPAALPIFARILPKEENEALYEWFDMALPQYYGSLAIPLLVEMLADQSDYDYPVISACDMLARIALYHPEERDRITAILCSYLPPLDESGALLLTDSQRRDPPILWSWIVNAFLDLRYTDEHARVKALFDADVLDVLIFGDWEDYQAGFAPGAPVAWEVTYVYDIIEDYEKLYASAQADVRQKAQKFMRDLATRTPEYPTHALSFTRETPKVGRNDPCPCGSGKKYKHCCGKMG